MHSCPELLTEANIVGTRRVHKNAESKKEGPASLFQLIHRVVDSSHERPTDVGGFQIPLQGSRSYLHQWDETIAGETVLECFLTLTYV